MLRRKILAMAVFSALWAAALHSPLYAQAGWGGGFIADIGWANNTDGTGRVSRVSGGAGGYLFVTSRNLEFSMGIMGFNAYEGSPGWWSGGDNFWRASPTADYSLMLRFPGFVGRAAVYPLFGIGAQAEDFITFRSFRLMVGAGTDVLLSHRTFLRFQSILYYCFGWVDGIGFQPRLALGFLF